MEHKIIAIYTLVVLSILVSLSNCEDIGNEFAPLTKYLEDNERHSSELEFFQEEARSKQCIPRTHDCTSNRHGCCRGKMFKDVCMCFYEEGNNTSTDEEKCTCQQPWYHESVEDMAHRISMLTKDDVDEEENCIAKHHECTRHKESCCTGKLFKYKCTCYETEDEEGNQKERCACETPFHHKMAEMGMKAWNSFG